MVNTVEEVAVSYWYELHSSGISEKNQKS